MTAQEEEIVRAYDALRFDERIPEEAGFAAIFEEKVKPAVMAGMEFEFRLRKKRRLRLIGASLVLVLLYAALTMIAIASWDPSIADAQIAVLVAGGALASIFALAVAFMKRPGDRNPITETVLGIVLESLGSRFTDRPNRYHPMNTDAPILPEGNVFQFGYERLEGLFDGRTPYGALRLSIEKPTSGKRWTTTFAGWYLCLDLPFAFSGTTVIWERGASRRLRGGAGALKVELEDPEFSRRFEVASTDQVEARVILAPDVMRHLASVKRLLGESWHGGLMLGFSGRRAHVWIPSNTTALASWHLLDPARFIEDLHAVFAEMATLQAYFRDIDVIAESEGFRAQAARNGRAS